MLTTTESTAQTHRLNRSQTVTKLLLSVPARGLTVAGDLAKLGYKVTIFEALHLAGGVFGLWYSGIPSSKSNCAEGN